MTGVFPHLSRVLPDQYPLTEEVDSYLADELGLGRLLDYGVGDRPERQQLYEWWAQELRLLDRTRNGALTYAWPFEN